MDQRDAAQALELVRALRQQLHEMSYQLTWLERHQNVTGTNGQASANRCEAAALRQDINEAQTLINRLQRRYLNSNGRAQLRPPARHQGLAEPGRAPKGEVDGADIGHRLRRW